MLAAKVLKLLEKMSTRNKRTVGSLYRVSSIRDIDFNLGCLMLEGGTENLGALSSISLAGRGLGESACSPAPFSQGALWGSTCYLHFTSQLLLACVPIASCFYWGFCYVLREFRNWSTLQRGTAL